jgi:hypothetical protein
MRATTGRLTAGYNEYEQSEEQTTSFFVYSLANQSIFEVNNYFTSISKVKNYSASIGAERQWDERFSLSADFGWRYTESTQDYLQVQRVIGTDLTYEYPYQEKSDGGGFTGQFGGSYQGEVTRGNLSVSQEVSGASGTTGATDRTTLRGTVGRQLTDKMRLDFMAEYYINTSVQDDASRGSDVDENTLRFNPRMAYQLNQDFGVEAAYMFEQVDDQEDDTVSERNVVWCRLVYQYPLFE